MSTQHTNGYDPDAAHRRQQSNQEHAQAVGTAHQQAARSGPDLSDLQQKEFLDAVFTSDVNRGDGVPGIPNNRLEERYAAEFSRHRGLANISKEEWERRKLINQSKAIRACMEYARPRGAGHKCSPQLRQAWGDTDDPLPTMDDDLYRETRAAFEELTDMESLSIDAKGFSGVTEVHAVTKSEGFSSGGSSGNNGLLSRVTGGLFGGA